MVNLKKIVILIILVPAALLFAYMPAEAASAFTDLAASSALLAEADTGTLLYSSSMSDKHPADALTRVMTLLLAVAACESGDVKQDELIEMTESAWDGLDANSSTLGIKPGEKMPMLDLMYCAFLGGAGEACNLIAERVAGSVSAFVSRMNTRASGLSCENTHYTNTHGQYNENQYTTAQDQFYIFREAMNHPLFAEIAGTYRYTVEATNQSDARNLVSPNSMLNTNGKYYYSPCTAGAASASFEGGYSFVAFAESDGLSLISVVLGSDVVVLEDKSTQMRNLTESRRLLDWGFSQFAWRTVLSSDTPMAKAPILHGAGADFVNLRPETSIKMVLDKDISLDEFKRTVTIYSTQSGEELTAPISAGEILGEVTISRNGVDYGPIKLVANTNVELNRLEYIRMQLIDLLSSQAARMIIVALCVLLLLYAVLVIRYNVIRRKRIRRIKEAKRRLINNAQSNEDDNNQSQY